MLLKMMPNKSYENPKFNIPLLPIAAEIET